MKNITKFASLTSILAIASCASIIEGSTDRVEVNTVPPSGAMCTMQNGRGSASVSVPGSATVQKSKTDLNINCQDQASGASGTKTVESGMEGWFLGNLVFGGFIGGGVDAATGSMWEYPKDVTVNLVGAPQQPQPYYTPTYTPAPQPMYAPAPVVAPQSSLTPAAAQNLAPAAGNPPANTSYYFVNANDKTQAAQPQQPIPAIPDFAPTQLQTQAHPQPQMQQTTASAMQQYAPASGGLPNYSGATTTVTVPNAYPYNAGYSGALTR